VLSSYAFVHGIQPDRQMPSNKSIEGGYDVGHLFSARQEQGNTYFYGPAPLAKRLLAWSWMDRCVTSRSTLFSVATSVLGYIACVVTLCSLFVPGYSLAVHFYSVRSVGYAAPPPRASSEELWLLAGVDQLLGVWMLAVGCLVTSCMMRLSLRLRVAQSNHHLSF